MTGPRPPRRTSAALAFALAALASFSPGRDLAAENRPPRLIVLCAPGYPGSTAQAQPTMDAFAKGVARAAKHPESAFAARYFESEAGGLAALASPDAVLAIVTLPFYFEHGKALGLSARLKAVEEASPEETWTLVARSGALSGPASLAGWEITGAAGLSRSFVLGPALASWGPVPASATVSFSPRILTALKRSAAGEKLAVLLNHEQSASLPTLPFAKDLAVAAVSRPMPGSVLCSVGTRLDRAETGLVLDALSRMDDTADGQALLKTMRLSHFELLRPGELDPLAKSFAQAGGPAPPRTAAAGAASP
jgi:hypothetical protein